MLQVSTVFSHESAQRAMMRGIWYMKRTPIDESVDVTSPRYWFAIQKAFAFFLLTTIHRIKVDFPCFVAFAWRVETLNQW